jgi:GNAT superfamily N-acetyltransferase
MSDPVLRAASAESAVVGRLLWEFNEEFSFDGPGAAELAGRFTNLLDRDDVVVLLSGSREDPTGFAFFTLRPTPYYDGPLAQLEELYVKPHLRDQGVGTALLSAAVDLVRSVHGGEIQHQRRRGGRGHAAVLRATRLHQHPARRGLPHALLHP